MLYTLLWFILLCFLVIVGNICLSCWWSAVSPLIILVQWEVTSRKDHLRPTGFDCRFHPCCKWAFLNYFIFIWYSFIIFRLRNFKNRAVVFIFLLVDYVSNFDLVLILVLWAEWRSKWDLLKSILSVYLFYHFLSNDELIYLLASS